MSHTCDLCWHSGHFCVCLQNLTGADNRKNRAAFTRDGRKQLFAVLQGARGSSGISKLRILLCASSISYLLVFIRLNVFHLLTWPQYWLYTMGITKKKRIIKKMWFSTKSTCYSIELGTLWVYQKKIRDWGILLYRVKLNSTPSKLFYFSISKLPTQR